MCSALPSPQFPLDGNPQSNDTAVLKNTGKFNNASQPEENKENLISTIPTCSILLRSCALVEAARMKIALKLLLDYVNLFFDILDFFLKMNMP